MSQDPAISLRPRKARDLLAAYYGTVTEKEVKEASPYDLDSTIYNNTLNMAKFMKETHLVDVIRRDNELITEIRDLDGNMQTLVYENYGQFIGATDTIKTSAVDTMDAEIERLCGVIDKISTRTQSVFESMAPKRAQINTLYSTHEMLNKLNFIFELPSQLNKCYRSGHYEHAVFYYNRTSLLIEHYEDQSMFKSISKENKIVLERIIIKLKEKITRDSTSISDVAQTLGLLVTLDVLPATDVAAMHIDIIKKRISVIIDSFVIKKVVAVATMAKSITPIGPIPIVYENPITQRTHTHLTQIIKPLSLLVETFSAYYLNEGFEMPVSQAIENIIKHQNKLENAVVAQLKFNLVKIISTLINQYFDLVQVSLPSYIPTENVFSFSNTLEALDLLHRETVKLDAMNTLFDFNSSVVDFTEKYFSAIVNGTYNNIINITIDRVAKVKYPSEVTKLEIEITKKISYLNDQAVVTFKEFIKSGEYHSGLSNCMLQQCKKIEIHFNDFWDKLVDKAKASLTNPMQLITMSKLMLTISKTTIPTMCLSYESAGFIDSPVQIKIDNFAMKSSSSGIDLNVSAHSQKITAKIDLLSQIMLDNYVEESYKCITETLSEYITDREIAFGLTNSTPTSVSPAFISFIVKIKEIESIATKLYPEKRKRSNTSYAPRIKTSPTQKDTGFDGMFEKLFGDKVTYFCSVERAYASILIQLHKLSLKIRDAIFDSVTQAQIVIDLEYWKQGMGVFLMDEPSLYRLVQEVTSCSQIRCSEVKNIDPKTLARIVFAALPKKTDNDT